jgi:hypothetical protein
MKKFILGFIAMILFCAPATKAAPDLKDLLSGLAGGSSSSSTSSSTSSSALSGALGSLISGLLGSSTLTESDIAGVYKYKEPAITFQSENFLQKAGGAAVGSVIVDKLTPYYKKAGMENLTVTLNYDKTFTFALKKATLSGTFARDSSKTSSNYFIFTFKALGSISFGSIEADVQQSTSGIIITFDASKLISLMNTVASISGQSTVQTVASLLNSYDGLNAGFSLTKTANASGSATSTSTSSSSSTSTSTSTTGSSILGSFLGGMTGTSSSSSSTTNSSSSSSTTNSSSTSTSTSDSTQSGLGSLLNLLKR